MSASMKNAVQTIILQNSMLWCRPLISNCLHTTSVCFKKTRKFPKHVSYWKIVSDYELDRIQRGLSRTGTEYGPLTDKPDWRFADGTAGYLTSGQKRRMDEQRNLATCAAKIIDELDLVKTAAGERNAINSTFNPALIQSSGSETKSHVDGIETVVLRDLYTGSTNKSK